MSKTVLTDLTVQRLKTPGLYWDSTLPAFGLRVGKLRKTWLVVPDQRRVRKVIGHYPAVPVAKARALARRLLANRSHFNDITFGEALDQFLDLQKANTRPSTYAATARHLNGYLRPTLAKRPLDDVKTAEVLHPIDQLHDRPSEARHAFIEARHFIRWASSRRYCTNILDGVKPPPLSTPRARVLSDAEVKSIWRACEQTGEWSGSLSRRPGSEASETCKLPLPRLPAHFATIVKLLILTAQRRGEIAALRAEYCDLRVALCGPGNGETECRPQCTITLPANLTKNGREHTFPLGSIATGLLSFFPAGSHFLFPARTSKTTRPFNGWSKSKKLLDELSGVSGWTLHDIRRTVATRMAELGVAPHVIERLLNHATGSLSPIALVYNRAKYVQEMREAVFLWEAHLLRLLQS